jgi:hypothetical protein
MGELARRLYEEARERGFSGENIHAISKLFS